jgi:glycosyltransferase involved in cell wall biosynthesis
MPPHIAAARAKISLLAPDLSGGGVTRVYLLAQVLRRIGCEVEIVGGLLREGHIYPEPPPELTVTVLRGAGFWRLARSVLRQLDGDLIYAVKPRATSFGIGLLARLRTRLPLAVDIDDWELSFYNGAGPPGQGRLRRLFGAPDQAIAAWRRRMHRLMNPEDRLYVAWMERLVRRADAVTVNNRFLQARYGGVLLPSGKDTALFDPARYDRQRSREELGLPDYQVLMFPGTPRPHKGLEDVLAALERLNRPDLRLVLVGGRKTSYTDALLEEWGRWIVQLPRFPGERMPEVIAAADLIVIPQRDTPSARAQFPMKLTDAMAMGKPILSTRVGDIPEILGDTGHLVEPASPAQLAEGIQWLLEHPAEAQRLGDAARRRCIERYSLDALATILSGVLTRLL